MRRQTDGIQGVNERKHVGAWDEAAPPQRSIIANGRSILTGMLLDSKELHNSSSKDALGERYIPDGTVSGNFESIP
jgi:hypothetical protein